MLIRKSIWVLCLTLGAGAALAEGGKKSSTVAVPDAPVCASVAFQDGTMTCNCAADAAGGSVWGSGPYTADSNICAAARHSGAIGSSGGIVQLLERPGQASYSGSTANGVTTSDWGSYGQSFAVAGARVVSDLPVCSTIPAGVDDHSCRCAANPTQGSVWGNGPYTSDSDICSAAIHANFIEGSVGGDIYVIRIQGLESYYGSENSGVTTSDWGSYDDSITFDWNR